MDNFFTVPNILTVSRILLLPFFVAGFFIESKFGLILSLFIFLICCITDYLDGYYARAYKQITKIGKMLDPLADKILISISLLFISGFNLISKIGLIAASIILCREIIISGFRESVEESGQNFKTSMLAKWKTAAQMLSIIFIFIGAILKSNIVSFIGEGLLWISSIVAVLSAIKYCKKQYLI